MRASLLAFLAAAAAAADCRPDQYPDPAAPGQCRQCPPGPRGQGPNCTAPAVSGFGGWGCTFTGPAQSSISASTLVLLAQPLQSQAVTCTGPAVNPLQSFVATFSVAMTSPLNGGADEWSFFFDASQSRAVDFQDLGALAQSCGPQGCGAPDPSAFAKAPDFTYSVSVAATYDACAGTLQYTVGGASGSGRAVAAGSYVVGALDAGALGFYAWNGASAYVRTVTDFVYQAGVACCPAGALAQPWGALTRCAQCPPGSWSAQGAASCTPCSAGTASAAPGAAAEGACQPCAPDSWSAAGAASCAPCVPGSWSAAGAASCTPCTAANSSLAPCATVTATPTSSASASGSGSGSGGGSSGGGGGGGSGGGGSGGGSSGTAPAALLLVGASAAGGLAVGALGLWLAQRLLALRAGAAAVTGGGAGKAAPLLYAVQ
jgi:hypothetical protein